MFKSITHYILVSLLVIVTLFIASCGPSTSPATSLPPTLTPAPPSPTAIPPTATSEPPTATPAPTNTPLPPTATAEPPTPTPWPPLSESGGGAIAFTSERGGYPGIAIMNADGSDQRLLTNDFDAHPDWSPDGKLIAFSTSRSNLNEIFTVDVASNSLRRLTNTERSPSAPDWSPDGERFVLVYNPTHPGINYELYLMSAGGKNFIALTDSVAYRSYAGPDWSPDGERIVFSVGGGGTQFQGAYNIYLMDSDGSDVQQLTFSEDYDDRFPAWSPDGTKIAFETRRDGNWEIYLMNVDGTGLRNISNNPGKDLWASWSPDGTRIAFQTDRDDNWEIYVMNADGTEQQRLTNNDVKDSEPVWKP